MYEYRIMELSQLDYGEPPFEEECWYPHGGVFTEGHRKKKAVQRLKEMQDRYSKYGRVFRIERRKVTHWQQWMR